LTKLNWDRVRKEKKIQERGAEISHDEEVPAFFTRRGAPLYTTCTKCNVRVNKKHFAKHLRKVHGFGNRAERKIVVFSAPMKKGGRDGKKKGKSNNPKRR